MKSPKATSLAEINGLLSKFDDISLLLSRSNIDFLCLNETLLHSDIDDSVLQVDGYEFIRCDRDANSGKKSGGGLVIYYKSDRDVEELPTLSHCSPSLESVWVRLNLKLANLP